MVRKTRNLIIILAFLIASIIIFYSLNNFGADVDSAISELAISNVEELATSHQNSVDYLLQQEIKIVESIADSLVVFGYDEQSILNYISSLKFSYSFDTVYIVDEKGLGMNNSGHIIDISDEYYFDTAIKGETNISNVEFSYENNNKVVIISTPIYEFNVIVGVLAVEYPIEFLSNLLPDFLEGEGISYILKNDGTLITSNVTSDFLSADNIFISYKNAEFENDVTVETIQNNIANGISGELQYVLNENRRFAVYKPLKVNDWFILLAAPYSVITENVNYIEESMSNINFITIAVSLFLIICIWALLTYSSKEIEKTAYSDELTGLNNINKFKLDVKDILQKNNVKSNFQAYREYSIIKFDIVNFKVINEIFNFETGNQVLRTIAKFINTFDFENMVCSRINTDEFLIFSLKSDSESLSLKGEYEASIKRLIPEIKSHNLQFRYGLYNIEPNEVDINDIINKVNLAHNNAKSQKDDKVYIYDIAFKQRLMQNAEITNKMHDALTNEEFKVFLQAKHSLKTEKIVGAESLVRWIDDKGAIVYPGYFIPLFEQNNFIVQLDMYMFENVCKIMRSWIDNNIKIVPISVNFSKAHFTNKNFVTQLIDISNKYDIPKEFLEIEITETVLIENEQEYSKLFEELYNSGFIISMDDFGSGYSSLGALKNMNVHTIKFDRSFLVNDKVENEEKNMIVVKSLVEMAQKLNIKTVAEGVETKAQVEFLKNINCDVAQGFLFSKPIPKDDFTKLLK